MEDFPYIPEIWKDLKLEFTDEYIEKRKKIKKIIELNNINYKTPKTIKKSNKNKKYDGCLEKNSYCIIL